MCSKPKAPKVAPPPPPVELPKPLGVEEGGGEDGVAQLRTSGRGGLSLRTSDRGSRSLRASTGPAAGGPIGDSSSAPTVDRVRVPTVVRQ